MSVRQQRQNHLLKVIPVSENHGERSCDSSGYQLFSDGDAGNIHVIAHRMLDIDRNERGRQLLGDWLDGHTGSGSEWLHLQWHMAVFDLSSGHWNAALARFRQEILPAVTNSYDALTDAPALLWRLFLASDTPVALPWEPVRLRALAAMQRPRSAFVEIHNVLALAGSGDLDNLTRWLQQRRPSLRSRADVLVTRIATALQSYVAGDHKSAAVGFETVIPFVAEIGGSRAQNQLFRQLQASAWHNANGGDSLSPQLKAA